MAATLSVGLCVVSLGRALPRASLNVTAAHFTDGEHVKDKGIKQTSRGMGIAWQFEVSFTLVGNYP
jgi:hypothetical protein